MIKVSGQRPIRSTTAKYLTDKGESVDITVEYYSITTAHMKKRFEEARKADEKYAEEVEKAKAAGKSPPPRLLFGTDELAKDLYALPDLADEKGKPFKITADNLDKIDQRNINAIRDAINDDINGKKSQPAD